MVFVTFAKKLVIGIADQIHVDATSFCDVLMKSQIIDGMIKVCLDNINYPNVSNDFLKNTFVAIKFLCLEEPKKWNKINIDYFVNECGLIQLLTGKWYKEMDQTSRTFTYTFQTVQTGCFLFRGILVSMNRNLNVSEEARTTDMIKYLTQGQRNDVSPDYVKQLQDGYLWKQKRAKQPQQQKGKNNNKNNKNSNNNRQQQQQRQQQRGNQGNQGGQNKGGQQGNKDDCIVM